MGAKYLPTVKDMRASQRFQKQGFSSSKFIKPAPAQRPPSPSKVTKPPSAAEQAKD